VTDPAGAATGINRESVRTASCGYLSLVATTSTDRQTRITLRGELDLYSARLLRDEFDATFAAGTRLVTVDLDELTFVDAAGIDAMVQAHRRFLAARRALRLARPSPRLVRLLALLDLDRTLLGASETDGYRAAGA
jgi:anti-sigma B factor antagonist